MLQPMNMRRTTAPARPYSFDQRVPVLTLLSLMTAVLVVNVWTLRAGQPWWDDFALYVLHARNIVEGIAYADTGYVHNPQNPFHSPAAYPPGFPLLLAPIYALVGTNLFAMRVMVIGCFVAGLYCFALLLSRYHKQTVILAAVILVGLQPYLLGFKNLLLPDLPFMLFVLLSLYFIQLLDEPGGQENEIAIGSTAGVCMFYAASLRTIGVSILGAAFLLYLLRRRFPPRGVILACAVAVLLLVIQTELMPEQPGYASQVAASVSGQSADSIVMLRLRHIRAMFVATEPLWHSAFLPATVVLMFASTGLAVIGFVSRLRSASILETFCISYVGLLFVWPWVQTRYMIPLVPLLIHYALLGFGVVSRAVPRTARAAGLGLVALVTLVYAENLIGADRTPFQDGATGEAALEMYSYVTRCTAVDARFVFSRPRALALFTGRQAMAPAVRVTDLEDVVEQGRIDYVVSFRDGTMDHLSAERPDVFQLVFRNDRHVVYRYASDELPGRKACDTPLSSAPSL